MASTVSQRRWQRWGGGGGLLTTAGGLVFAGDAGGNIVAYDAATGAPLWHSHIGNVTAPPQTYMLDGRQYLLVAIGDKLYSFTLYLKAPSQFFVATTMG